VTVTVTVTVTVIVMSPRAYNVRSQGKIAHVYRQEIEEYLRKAENRQRYGNEQGKIISSYRLNIEQ
jgi:hypothetical protein